jgi:DNA-binding MarR family transcriptional regulator/GNAT superfamily N-acetyltransferase
MAAIDRVRSFNRTVSQRVGALDDRFLGRGRPLAASRLLWEIGPDGAEVRALRARLDLDSAHVSRLLRSLEGEGLAVVEPDASDRRVRVARLTAAGRAERAVLDERSDEFARSMLAGLGDDDRDRLVDAMRTVERLLVAARVEMRDADPREPDARQCLRAYVAELNARADRPFDPQASRQASAEPEELIAPAGAFVVAYLGSEPVGCGGVKHKPGAPAELKRMWLAPSARGLGLGRRLLDELERRAREAGARTAHIETNASLTEAIALYRSAGYADVEPFNDEPFADLWLAKRLVRQADR